MKIMLDTNVLISALIFGGTPKQLIGQLLLTGHDIYISDYVENEFLDKIHLKLGEVRDKKDIPVLSDALYNNIDILLTGDKDFLESEIKHPIIFLPKMLMEYLFYFPVSA